MSPQTAPAFEKALKPTASPRESVAVPMSFGQRWDACLAVTDSNSAALWANRAVLLGLFIFALSLPHSIAAAHIGLDFSLLAWIVRDVLMRRLQFKRTPLDFPLVCFLGLTLLSTIFSTEPALSYPKLKSLLLFGVLYIFATNLSARAVKPLLLALVLSGLAGALFSFADKIYGRGLVITSIDVNSPLLRDQPMDSRLDAGDAIWMIARQRVYSLADIQQVIRQHRVGARLDIEALHRGDPIPACVTVTEAMLTQENPLGVVVAGRTQRFRVTGFGRQFQTYAEQMQLLALLCYGVLLIGWRQSKAALSTKLMGALFLCFSLGLVLTYTRAVLAAFLLALLLVPLCLRGKRAVGLGLMLAVLIGGTAVSWLGSVRSTEVMRDSTSRRLEYMQAGLRLIPKHPLFGIGMDSAKAHWQAWGFPGLYVTHTHSTPIQIAMERGVPALLALIWLWGMAMLTAWRTYQESARVSLTTGLALSTLGALLGFGASSLVNYNFGDAEVLLLLLSIFSLMQVSRPSGTTPAETISGTPN